MNGRRKQRERDVIRQGRAARRARLARVPEEVRSRNAARFEDRCYGVVVEQHSNTDRTNRKTQ